MKKLFTLLVIVALILSGCSEGAAANGKVSVQDALCPYEITPKNNGLEITLSDGEMSGITWLAEIVPQEICEVSNPKPGQYRITGSQEGAAQVTFTAQKSQTVQFVLTVVVHVDAEQKTTLTSYQHRQRDDVSVEADGLNYSWNVDIDGILTFSFINSEDLWSVRGDGEGVVALQSKMSTPSGCKFTAQAASPGQRVISLVGESTQRTIDVTIQCDDQGELEVISVKER